MLNRTSPPPARALPRPGVILLAVAGALGILLLSVGVLQTINRYQAQRDEVLERTAQDADVVASRFDQFFRERFEYLDAIAQSPVVQSGQPAEIKAYFERISGRESSFSGGLSLIGTDGVMRLLSNYPLDAPPLNLADRDYVQTVLRTGAPYFGNAILGRATGEPLLTVAVPVRNDRGEVTGVIAGTIRIDIPDGGLARIGAELSNAVILDGSDQVVVDRGAVSKPAPAAPEFVAAIGDRTDTGHATAGAPAPDGSGEWIVGSSAIGASAWRAVVIEDQSDAFAPLRRTLLLEAGALALVAALGTVVTVLAARRLNYTAEVERLATERAREREAFFRELADALPVLGGTLDAHLATTFANRALRATPSAQLLDLLHPEDAETLRVAEAQADADSTLALDLRLATGRNGQDYRWHRVNLVPAPQLRGVRWFFAAADVDDEKRLELGLQRDIQQRDEFLGLVSHEIRNPLAAILGNAAMLTGRYGPGLPKDAYESAEEIDLSARRLRRLVENMLVLSQASSGESPPQLEPQLVPRLFQTTATDFHARYPTHDLEVTVEPDLPVVLANETFVDQILWNLLTNAAKYGGPSREINLAAHRTGSFVEVSVTDRGHGLSPDELERVFDAHFRSRNARAHAEGLGLGLSVCRRLVEAQGGTIEARLTPGGGTTLAFTLPVADD